jgi:hypothetical protein
MLNLFIIYRPGARAEGDSAEYAGILPEVMIFPEGLCPERNIITEGNISTNPPSGGSINYILYRMLKNPLSSE